jgi:alanine-glyoxylate transaminase/serine-glyoxylate transaminase/serine-pyruvate transaminase
MPDRVLNAMHRASPNIYEGELLDMTHSLYPDLKTLARTSGNAAIYIGNGHATWEVCLRNTLVEGDTVLVLITGRFAEGWGEAARALGIKTQILDFGMQAPVDPTKVEETLRADKDGKIRAVLTVQTDTASSVLNDVVAIRKAMDAADSEALLMVDGMASLGCDRFEMDAWGADIYMAGCQKGLMTPAGLAFVFFNDRATDARKRVSPGKYWDWVPRVEADYFYMLFSGTAPTHHLYGLREALNMLVHEEGVENVWARHDLFARAIWAAVEAWGEGGDMALNIATPAHRSRAVTTVATGSGEAKALREWTEREAGVTLGIGLGFGEQGSQLFNSYFRIGHMGHLNIPMVMGTLGSIDCGLKALGMAHGDGALDAASRVLRGRLAG